jgi:hypothetical protein
MNYKKSRFNFILLDNIQPSYAYLYRAPRGGTRGTGGIGGTGGTGGTLYNKINNLVTCATGFN